MPSGDTIFALSSGAPPAAIATIRISGSLAKQTLATLTGALPSERQAALRSLRDPADGRLLDRAVVIWFAGPATATGEDLVELHLHGGRAVVRAVETALANMPGLRMAEPGEFTRRAFSNGRIDLAEAEGLGDLLLAETEAQRVAALRMASGHLSRLANRWREAVLRLSAMVEAELDFSDEDDVDTGADETLRVLTLELAAEIDAVLARPHAERLKDGIRVVLAGPPNAGKSTLLNALVQRDAAIVSDIAGTTRDIIAVPVAYDGVPFVFSDTAGLRDDHGDGIEAIGIARAQDAIATADIVLWLGVPDGIPQHPAVWQIAAKVDRADVSRETADVARHLVSALTGEGIDALIADLVASARQLLPAPEDLALNARQHRLISQCGVSLHDAAGQSDPLIRAEALRQARAAIDSLLGHSHVEDMLDTLFGRFCIGK